MNTQDFIIELEMISLENQGEIVKEFGVLPYKNYLEVFTFTCCIALEVCKLIEDEVEQLTFKLMIYSFMVEKARDTYDFFKTKKRVLNTFINARKQYYRRDISEVLKSSSTFNFDYTSFHFYSKDISFGFPVQEIFDDPLIEKYQPNPTFDQLMEKLTIKSYHSLVSYISYYVPTIRGNKGRLDD
ncbi:MAG: hypothetical protein P8O16_20250 [Algoriphagus sp.]|uniref:hypothetical protein n=1 Tax=Algoriphagus sp. TaxID=1872435 RepID=UPI00263854A3|nr:hypothetical protein [Algoriphagus sp.]MDG1279613.1 hypothetical protein [Algoriphagus sp.]